MGEVKRMREKVNWKRLKDLGVYVGSCETYKYYILDIAKEDNSRIQTKMYKVHNKGERFFFESLSTKERQEVERRYLNNSPTLQIINQYRKIISAKNQEVSLLRTKLNTIRN